MKTFQVPTYSNVTLENQEIFKSFESKLGFVPNIYAAYALSENALGRFMSFANGKTSLSNKEKEAVNLVVSQINGCTYCLAAHTAIAQLNGFTSEEIIEFRKGSSANSRFNALVKLALGITENRGQISSRILEDFYDQGFTDENLVDLIVLIGEKTTTNLLHKVTNIPIDFPEAPKL